MIELPPFRMSGINTAQIGLDAPSDALSPTANRALSIFQGVSDFLKQASWFWKGLAATLDVVAFFVLVWAVDNPLLVCLLPLTLALLPLSVMLIWNILIGAHLAEPQMFVSSNLAQRGDEIRVMYRQQLLKNIEFTHITLQLVVREWVRYSCGTDTCTTQHDTVYQEKDYAGETRSKGDLLDRRVAFTLPTDAMHTFIASDNKIYWLIKIKLEMIGYSPYEEVFEVQVTPVANMTGVAA
jgi:hypothetical protein